MAFVGSLFQYLREVRVELKRVNWPPRATTVRYTLIVIGASIGVGLFLGALDFIFREALRKFFFP